MTRAANSSGVVSRTRRRFGCSGVRSSKTGAAGALVRGLAVDQLDLHQGEVLLPFDRQANRPLDHQAGAQPDAANLAGGDVDVFRRGQVVVGGAAQEAVAVRQHFEGAGAADDFAALDLPADDADNRAGRGSCPCARRSPRARRAGTAWAWANDKGHRVGTRRKRGGAGLPRRVGLRSRSPLRDQVRGRGHPSVYEADACESHCSTHRRYGRRP